MQVIARLCLSVVHGILFHPHEGGVGVGLRHRVALADLFQPAVVLAELVAVLFQFLHLFLAFAPGLLLLFSCRLRPGCECVFKLPDKRGKRLRGEICRLGRLCSLVLRYGFVHLLKQYAYLFLQLCPVLLHCLSPYEGVLVGL